MILMGWSMMPPRSRNLNRDMATMFSSVIWHGVNGLWHGRPRAEYTRLFIQSKARLFKLRMKQWTKMITPLTTGVHRERITKR